LRKKRVTFEDCQNWSRLDQQNLGWLVEKGFFAGCGSGCYSAKEKGKAAPELGLYVVSGRDGSGGLLRWGGSGDHGAGELDPGTGSCSL